VKPFEPLVVDNKSLIHKGSQSKAQSRTKQEQSGKLLKKHPALLKSYKV